MKALSISALALLATSLVNIQAADATKPPAPAPAPLPGAIPTPAGNDEVRKIAETYAGRGVQRDNTPPTPAKDALKTFTMRDGYAIELMAAEPEIFQPLYMSWDSRGRLWVTEYLQYQFPAGLKIVSYDQHL